MPQYAAWAGVVTTSAASAVATARTRIRRARIPPVARVPRRRGGRVDSWSGDRWVRAGAEGGAILASSTGAGGGAASESADTGAVTIGRERQSTMNRGAITDHLLP